MPRRVPVTRRSRRRSRSPRSMSLPRRRRAPSHYARYMSLALSGRQFTMAEASEAWHVFQGTMRESDTHIHREDLALLHSYYRRSQ